MKAFKQSTIALCVHASLIAGMASFTSVVQAAEQADKVVGLEVIEVTARKRVENAQEVPVAISALQGDNLDAFSSAAMDIRFMNARVPSLSVESSFGRTFPRFYMRGLGNSDFDLNASQPVSLVVDNVVQENPILKGFPVFDIERIEVLRGPQGTLFGRNTPAGLIKFDSVKPSQDFEGFASLSYGSKSTTDFRGAVGGGLTDKLSARVSYLRQERDDYIDNEAPDIFGEDFKRKDVLGGYTDEALRVQFLYEGDDFNALFNYHMRDLDGKPVTFYANAFKPGSNDLVSGFDRDTVTHDSADRATQQVETEGASLTLDFDLDDYTITYIFGWESADIFSRADVDGGYGTVFTPIQGPGVISISSETADAIPDHDQLTQELRLTSNFDGQFNYQVGVFYFDEDLEIESFAYDALFGAGGPQTGYVVQKQETKAWALFGSFDYDYTDETQVTLGLRYSADDKQYSSQRFQAPLNGCCGQPNEAYGEVNPDDSHVSWDISVTHKLNDDVNVYGRVADSFRAPSIQGRSLFAWDDGISVADSETILSFETGVKADVLDGFGRVNASVFYFTMDDQQLTSVGGDSNTARLLNADETKGYGFEVDSEFMITDNFFITASVSYNNTELNDKGLTVPVCAQCTVTDTVVDGRAIIDGNSLPHAPEWISVFTARYMKEIGDGEFYAYTDWSYRDDISFFLYESKEFTGKSLLEGGVRVGYSWYSGDNEYDVAIFGRNITDEQQAIGAVDFSNNTAIVNEERFVGAEFKVSFF
ncbi:TonB-dependent receptor [Thalassotalea atypica]|uniref:TonB-dependent receptor n=1 Tax=Thalassotalea atypica TaxID=2054316 RepID=UPI0025727AB9|nr:TonB-dependent receptor [Thalassotalea atypica]